MFAINEHHAPRYRHSPPLPNLTSYLKRCLQTWTLKGTVNRAVRSSVGQVKIFNKSPFSELQLSSACVLRPDLNIWTFPYVTHDTVSLCQVPNPAPRDLSWPDRSQCKQCDLTVGSLCTGVLKISPLLSALCFCSCTNGLMSELLQAIQREKIQYLENKCVIMRKLGRVVHMEAVYIFVKNA